ncbi:MAG: transcriptional regulator [Candidatus Eisenbacteria bacterium]|nr:transcriptional regulator [Candidatus Eisenbacteria bacterium]
MRAERDFEFDLLIHSPVRLAVLSVLSELEDADFVFLRETVGATDGNLSTHLARLEEAGYVRIRKAFANRKPRTTCAITPKGRKAFVAYLEHLERIVRTHRGVKGGRYA